MREIMRLNPTAFFVDNFCWKCFYIIRFVFPLAFQRRIPNCSTAKVRDATTITKHVMENSHRKFSLDSKSHRKKRTDALEKKYRNIYVYLPRYRVSQRLFDGKFAET